MKRKKRGKIFVSSSLRQTKKFAADLAQKIMQAPLERRAHVIALKGELGAGKTSFVQGFAKGLGVKERIASPTFLIVKSYKIQDTKYKIQTLYHIDCYRLKSPKELLQLGWEEIAADPNNIVAVEWADRAPSLMPRDALWISFSGNKKRLTGRNIKIDRAHF